MFRTMLLSSFSPFYRPDDGTGSGGDAAPDDMMSDIEAAFAEVESGGGDGSDTGLGDGATSKGDGAAAGQEPPREARRDGQQEKADGQGDARDGVDRGDGKDHRGRFVAKDTKGQRPTGDKSALGQQDQQAAKPGGKGAAADTGAAQTLQGEHPPSSFSVRSKASWDAFKAQFPWIAADIAKREGEVNEGFTALRDYKDLKPYAEMARNSGTTLAAALHRFTNVEQLVKRNPAHGLISVCASIGMPKGEAIEALRNAIIAIGGDPGIPAHRTAGDPANGGGQGDQKSDPIAQLLQPILAPLFQEVKDLRTHLADQQTAHRTAEETSLDEAITAFAADSGNVFYNDVAEDMTRLFKSGMVPRTRNPMADLKTCYDMACRMHPEVSEALIEQRLGTRSADAAKREREVAQRARAAGRSLHGSSSPPDVEREAPADKKRDGRPSDEQRLSDVEAAYESVAGSASY